MTTIKTIQERLEQKVATDLRNSLKGKFMLENITLSDMASFVRKIFEIDQDDLSKSDWKIHEFVNYNNSRITFLREIMFDRMYPTELEKASKELTDKLLKL